MLKQRTTSIALAVLFASANLWSERATAQPCQPHWDTTIGNPGMSGGGWVWSLAAADGGTSKSALYVGGSFATAGGINASRIAKWDGSQWSALGTGASGTVLAIAPASNGDVYIGGSFASAGGLAGTTHIAKWTGSAWASLGGMDLPVNALALFNANLYAGGQFQTAGGVTAYHIARWNGQRWNPLDEGLGGCCQYVHSITVFDDGSGGGPALYVAGDFTTASGVPVSRIAKWHGGQWSALGSGSGTNGIIFAMTVFDDGSGSGPALYVAGNFTTASGVPASRIARWDGNAWTALGSGVNSTVWALAVFDDGSGGGPALYAGGAFTTAGGGGAPANHIAKWNGMNWSPLASGVNSTVYALAVLNGNLIVGGSFSTAGGQPSNDIAMWVGCPKCEPADITCDGVVNVSDLLAVINSWGPCPAPPQTCPADVAPPPNGDGVVNVSDLLMVINNWG